MKANQAGLAVGAALQDKMSQDKSFQAQLSADARSAGHDVAGAKDAVGRLNGRK